MLKDQVLQWQGAEWCSVVLHVPEQVTSFLAEQEPAVSGDGWLAAAALQDKQAGLVCCLVFPTRKSQDRVVVSLS